MIALQIVKIVIKVCKKHISVRLMHDADENWYFIIISNVNVMIDLMTELFATNFYIYLYSNRIHIYHRKIFFYIIENFI